MLKFLKRFCRDEEANVATEFAMTFPSLVLATLIIFDIGYAIFTYSAMSNAAADGARLGSVKAEEVETYLPDFDITVIELDLTDGDLSDIETYTREQLIGVTRPVTVDAEISAESEGQTLIVTVGHRHRFFVAGLLGIDGINIFARSRMLLL